MKAGSWEGSTSGAAVAWTTSVAGWERRWEKLEFAAVGTPCLNQHCCSLLSPHLTWGELIPREEDARDKLPSPAPLLGTVHSIYCD